MNPNFIPGALPFGVPYGMPGGIPVQPMGMPGMPIINLTSTPPLGMTILNPTQINAAGGLHDPNSVLPTTKIEKDEPLDTEHNARFNMEELLADIIVSSEYYKSLFRFSTVELLIEEFLKHAKNIEPRIPGLSRKASTAFCILYKLFTMNVGQKKILHLLEHQEALVRCLGLLYLRYILKPTVLWQYFEEHLDDPTEVTLTSEGTKTTVGQFATQLLSDIRYHGTTFPRIPKAVQLIFNREIVRREILQKRDHRNEHLRDQIEVGSKVKAQYSADWDFYAAIVDKILDDGMFLVIFDGYDEAEEVSIGMIRVEARRKRKRDSRERDRDRKRRRSRSRERRRRRSGSKERDNEKRERDSRDQNSRDRDRRSRDRRSNDRSRRSRADGKLDDYPDELTNEVLDRIIKDRESRAAHAVGRNYARPPIGLKRGLSVKSEVATIRTRSRTPEDVPRRRRRPMPKMPVAPKRNTQPSEEFLMRQKQLMQKYGHDPNSNSTAM